MTQVRPISEIFGRWLAKFWQAHWRHSPSRPFGQTATTFFDIDNGPKNKLLIVTLTDTGEDSKLVHRRKRPKVDTLFSSLSDASERRV